MADSDTQPQMPAPDPALKRLDRFVGTWSMEGHLVGSSENNIKGQANYRWLPGGFFLEQRVQLDFMGMQIDSLGMASGPGRGRDPERALRHQRAPREVNPDRTRQTRPPAGSVQRSRS
jgi:hypothetical protein